MSRAPARTLDIVLSHPGLYLLSNNKSIDATSCLVNLVYGLLEVTGLHIPIHIDLSVADRHFSAVATGCYLDELADQPELLPRFFDPSSAETDYLLHHRPAWTVLQPIVWFSEFCLVDICTRQDIYRQIYQDGNPLSEVRRQPLTDQEPYFSFVFTLSPQRFPNPRLDITRLRRAITLWKKDFYRYNQKTGLGIQKVEIQSRYQSDHHFSMRITPTVEARMDLETVIE